ncbi:uncharacterized protein BP5553_01202 [Venustampulla echinocandica]|uniref:Uncharacterized protein n=1 Tax=Venustampulla echinocandica TaxID=2656787 RepID=A0A370U0D9_9HELO|nr:uncharacterized protein BP5553_01202 [Venustampulla echinocandica]RDL41223.1 hypothetical protein BP5553_01202 [Venustampulla echinocandica]
MRGRGATEATRTAALVVEGATSTCEPSLTGAASPVVRGDICREAGARRCFLAFAGVSPSPHCITFPGREQHQGRAE